MDEHIESMDDYKTELEASFRKINEGDVITATVIAVSEEEATLDLKYFAPGIIRAQDLSDDPDYSILESLHPGDEIQAAVLASTTAMAISCYHKKKQTRCLAGISSKKQWTMELF